MCLFVVGSGRVAWAPLPGVDEDMPKNSSARRRRRAHKIAAEDGVKFTEALRRGDDLATQAREKTHRDQQLRPAKTEIDGIEKYVRHADAEQLSQDSMTDPDCDDIVAAADVLLPKVQGLHTAKLSAATVVAPSWLRHTLGQDELNQEFRTKVERVLDDLSRVRQAAAICSIDWTTVAAACYGVDVRLNELGQIAGAVLRDRVESAIDSAATLFMTTEAVHCRGCLLGSDRSRRLGWGYSPCGGGTVRVRVRVFSDVTIVTVPGCPRHAAEEIVNCDRDVEYDMVGVEVMGGTTADLDVIYALAEQVRGERDELQREQKTNRFRGSKVPEPPWHNGEDCW